MKPLHLHSLCDLPHFSTALNHRDLIEHQQMNADVEKLNLLRNQFVHFVPKGWSLEISGMPRIVRHCCDVIDHLAVRHPTFEHHLDGNRRRRIKSALLALRDAMDKLESGERD